MALSETLVNEFPDLGWPGLFFFSRRETKSAAFSHCVVEGSIKGPMMTFKPSPTDWPNPEEGIRIGSPYVHVARRCTSRHTERAVL